MKRRHASILVAAFFGISAAVPAREAKAEDLVAEILLVTVGVGAIFGWDVGFTAYDGGHVIARTEPDSGWMIAETAVAAPQALVGHVPMIVAELDDEKEGNVIGGVFLIPAIWLDQMTVFATWTLGDKSVDVRSRYGVSWLLGANDTLTTGMITSFFSKEHYARLWLSIPELAVGGAECAGTVVAAIHDPAHRGEWIGLAAWSGLLALHGGASLIAKAAARPAVGPDYPTPFEPPPLPPASHSPHHDLEVPGAPPPPRPPPPDTAKMLPPIVAPLPITDGTNVVPGVAVLGVF